MKVNRVFLMVLLAMATISRADSIDDAEAKRRGVSVERVQLDAQEQVADLKKQVADLQRKLDRAEGIAFSDREKSQAVAKESAQKIAEEKARADAMEKQLAALAPAEKRKIDAVKRKQEEIVAAIKEHRVVEGMTLDEAKKSAGEGASLKETSGVGEKTSYLLFSKNGNFSLIIENGKVVSWIPNVATYSPGVHAEEVYGPMRVP